MLKYRFKEYEVEIFSDSVFLNNPNLLKEKIGKYDSVYGDEPRVRPSSMHGIKIFKSSRVIKSVLLLSYGGASGIHKNSAIIDDTKLVICVGNNLFCLKLPQLELDWKIEADSATCFGVFKLKDDYIIHGELEISRISKTVEIEWQYSGKDIFTTPKGEEKFLIKNNHIVVEDWENNFYEIDFDGRGKIIG